jgi:hypothetical protein
MGRKVETLAKPPGDSETVRLSHRRDFWTTSELDADLGFLHPRIREADTFQAGNMQEDNNTIN